MSVFGCGINACNQIWEGGPHILCCPIPITCFQGITKVEVTFSHILWKTTLGWEWTGYKNHDVPDVINIDPQWKIFVSENRLAAINTFDSVVVWEKKGWRTLHFQKDYGKEVEATALYLLEKKIENYSENEINKEEYENCSSLRSVSSVDDIRSTLWIKKQGCLTKYGVDECERKESNTMQDSNKQEKLKVEDLTKPQDETCDADSSTSCSAQAIDQSHATGTSDLAFCHIAVEDNALFALDRDGVLYSGCVPISLRLKITEVALGKEHNVALTADGVLLTWGNGMRGQLGNGELCQSEKPMPVESLQGIAISSIVCGGWHSVALSHTGDAYVWGWNESGQLGFPAKSQGNLSVIESIEHQCQCFEKFPVEGKRICKDIGKKTMCDCYRTSHCKTEPQLEYLDQYPDKRNDDSSFEGNVDKVKRKKQNYKPSDSRINQRHNIDVINVQASPKLLDFWSENVIIMDVQCGDRHTLFQLDDGSVWSVGMNKYGQLGLGHTKAIEEPAEVFSKGVIRIYAGGWNSIFFTK